MLRFLSEFLRPAKKCARLGHVPGFEKTRGYKHPSEGYRSVADEVMRSLPVCCRCGKVMGEPTYEHLGHINSLGMSPERWEILRENGFLRTQETKIVEESFTTDNSCDTKDR